MRWSMFRNSLRTTQGAIELGARTIAFAFYTVMGLGMAAGFGGGAYAIVASEKWEILPALFWVLFVLWQVVPVTLASFQEHFDIGGLLRFPVGFGAFFLLHLIFGLVDASTMMGALCCLGIWIGMMIARPDLYAWAALALAVVRGVQYSSGARHLGVDRSLARAAPHARDRGRPVLHRPAEYATPQPCILVVAETPACERPDSRRRPALAQQSELAAALASARAGCI